MTMLQINIYFKFVLFKRFLMLLFETLFSFNLVIMTYCRIVIIVSLN
jgi:hypothetical protein